jgi:transcriptional regulator with XRE-family HTH domain
MMDFSSDEKDEDRAHTALLATALQAIRKSRRMKPSVVAAAMGLPVRTYEHFERGTGRISYSRIISFARATDSDPIAILAALPMLSPEFALNCADNKLMTIVVAALRRLEEELGSDIAYLSTPILVSAFDKFGNELVEQVRRRDQFAERWMEENVSKIAGATIGKARPKPIER